MNAWRRWSLALLGIGILLLFVAVMPGHLYSIDGLNYYRGAVRLLYDGAFTLDPPILWETTVARAPSGPIGFSLAYLPALAAAAPFRDLLPPISATPTDIGMLYDDAFYSLVAWVNPAAVALTGIAVAALARLAGIGPRASVGVAVVAVFATPLGFYGRADLAQPLMTLLVAASAVVVLGAHRRASGRLLWLLVPLLAWGVLTRPVDGTLLTVTVCGGLLLARWPGSRRWRPDLLVPPVLGFAVGLGLSLASNWLKSGRPLDYGYGPGFTGELLPGLVAWLVSPGRGLLWYAPVTAPAVVGAWLLARRGEHALLVLGAGLTALHLLVYSLWAGLGGWAWGPRFLVPVIPLLVVLAALPLVPGGGALRRSAFALLALVGALMNLGHLAADPLRGMWGVYGDSLQGTPGFDRQFELAANGGIGSWQYYHPSGIETLGDVLWLRLAPETGGLSLVVLAVLGIAGLLALAAAFALAGRGGVSARTPPTPSAARP